MNSSSKDYQIAATVAGAMIMGQVLFAGVCWFLFNNGSRTAAPTPRPLLLYLFLVLAVSAIAGEPVRRRYKQTLPEMRLI